MHHGTRSCATLDLPLRAARAIDALDANRHDAELLDPLRPSCSRPVLTAGPRCSRYLFIAFITAPTIPVRIAPPPAPPSASVRRPPRAPAAAGSAPAAPPRRLLRRVPPATPPAAPLMILVS